jgi:hypothetical protein
MSSTRRKLTGAAAALAMVAVIGGISLTGRWPRDTSLEQVTGKGILPLASTAIAKVEISGGDKEIAFEHRPSGAWVLRGEAIPMPIAEHVEAAIRFLNVSNPRRIFKQGDYDARKIAEFGLDPPRMLVTLVRANGKAQSLTFGETTPAGNSQYVRIVGKPNVYLLSRYVGMEWQIAADMAIRTRPTQADKDLAQRRPSLSFLPVSLAETSVVEIIENGALTRFERDPAGDWFHHFGQHVHTPGGFVHKADPKFAPLIKTELEALEQAAVEATIAEHPGEDTLAQSGLDHPSAILLLYTRDSSRPIARIEFGNQTEDGFARYARIVETDNIVTVPLYTAAHLNKLLQFARTQT